jgi:hypothetical protein
MKNVVVAAIVLASGAWAADRVKVEGGVLEGAPGRLECASLKVCRLPLRR